MRGYVLACTLVLAAGGGFAQDPTVGGPDQLSSPDTLTGPGVGFERDPAPLVEPNGDGADERDRTAIDRRIDSPAPFDRPALDTEAPGARLPGGPPPGIGGRIGGELGRSAPPPGGDLGDSGRRSGFGDRSGALGDDRLGTSGGEVGDSSIGR